MSSWSPDSTSSGRPGESSESVSTGNGHPTFVGPGFGTLLPPTVGLGDRPAVVSKRGTLRRGLPSVYHESDFTMRFVGALESLLDPIAAVLDALPAHFSPDYAPRSILDLLSSWLGIEVEEAQGLDLHRESVRLAAELGRTRGTVRGLELALQLSFPDVPMRVQDEGGVRWSMDGVAAPAEPARFIVYVDTPIPEEQQSAIARCIERQKPVETTYRLRVKTPKASQ
jgi:phage tail-like protein